MQVWVCADSVPGCRYVNSFDQWRPWDCGIETDDGAHGVWACFSERPVQIILQFHHIHSACPTADAPCLLA